MAWSYRSHDGLLLFSTPAGHGGNSGRDDRSGPRRQGSPGTETLIVGNAAIADLTLLKQGGAIVTGKGFGETNFIALDGAGSPLAQSLIRVVAAEMPCLCSAVWTANPIPARRNVYQPRSLATMPNILAMSRDR